METTQNTIIIYLLGTIGDSIVSIPSLKAIRRYFGKNAELILLHEKHSQYKFTPQNVLDQLGFIDRFISYPFKTGFIGKINTLLPLFFKLRKVNIDSVIYLIGSGYRKKIRVKRDLLFFKLCGAKKFYGFNHFNESVLHPRDNHGNVLRVDHESQFLLSNMINAGIEVKYNEDMAIPLFTIPKDQYNQVDKWLFKNRIYHNRPLIAICPGAKKNVCKWPINRFEEIGKRLIDSYAVELILIGGGQEVTSSEYLINKWQSGLNACGNQSIMESTALLSRCALMIGLDTGTIHLAAATNTPCIAILASHNYPGRWEPMGGGHIVIRKNVPCSGCLLKNCKYSDHPCMTLISVEDVWHAVNSKCLELGLEKGQHK